MLRNDRQSIKTVFCEHLRSISYGDNRCFRAIFGSAIGLSALVLVLGCPWSASAQGKTTKELPASREKAASGVVVDIDSPERTLYRVAVPTMSVEGAPQTLGGKAADLIRSDLKLISLFDILDPKSFVAKDKADLSIEKSSWTSVGAQGVAKGKIRVSGGKATLDAVFYDLSRGSSPAFKRQYKGKRSELRRFVHRFANEIVGVLTGEKGVFDTRITFTRRVGRGRKDVYVADFDGAKMGRVSSGKGVNMLSSFGPGGVWYSKLTRRGMFITNTKRRGKPVVSGNGMNMGVSACGNRIYFSSTRSGNSEIYSANTDGSGLKRLTKNRAIDVSPACGPGGKIAFVSTRQGGAHIFTMNSDGSGVKRVTYRGSYNQTPAWCGKADKPMIAFTGRSGGMDVFVVDLKTQKYTRLTQGQGINKDPAFSPDCRMVAFSSSRGGGGIFISSPEGLNQTQVAKGAAETIRWSR